MLRNSNPFFSLSLSLLFFFLTFAFCLALGNLKQIRGDVTVFYECGWCVFTFEKNILISISFFKNILQINLETKSI